MRALKRLAGQRTGWLAGIAFVAAVTGVIEVLKPHAPASGLAVLYLLAVLPAAVFWGSAVALWVSLLSAAALAFHSLDVSKPADGVALGVFVVTALVVSELSARSSREARVAKRLAEEQAALRRVATLVASDLPPSEVFAAVAEEIGRLVSIDGTRILRYEPDGTATVIAGWSDTVEVPRPLQVGSRLALEGESASARVFRTGRPVRIDNYADATGPLSESLHRAGVRSVAGAPITVEGRLWGVVTAGSTKPDPLPSGLELRLAEFTELVATAIANTESRAGLARLAEEQAALRRIATLVARGIPPEELFAAVTEEAGRVLGASLAGMARYGSDDTVTVLATWAADGEHGGAHPLVPGPWPLEGEDVASAIARTGRPVRIDDYDGLPGRIAGFVRDELGVRSSVGSPIVVEGRLWGALFLHSKQTDRRLPGDIEARLTGFTELVATAVANAEARAEVARLAEEQAALRRVATLVAREASPGEVFSAVTEELGLLIGANIAALIRLERGNTAIVVAAWSDGEGDLVPVGTRIPLEDGSIATVVARTGRPARTDSPGHVSGPTADLVHRLGVTSTVGTPIVVEGRLWGGMSVSSRHPEPLPTDTESRIADFAELVATAIANAEARTELTASRARVVAAADETRRRIERDLHDGIQQRLVSLGLELRAARATVPPELGQLEGELAHVAEGLGDVFDELREISHGIHPAVLSEGGLGPALRTLCRRSGVPVELDLDADRRLPQPVEVGAYYVVSEALSNAAKHAHASVVNVELDTSGSTLKLAIRDDGVGGADPGSGSGLVGLGDRIDALGGTLQVESVAGRGTTLLIEIPIEER